MAKLYGDIASSALMTFDKSFARANGQPLDSTEVYYSLEAAQTYAAGAGAYVGQKIAVIENGIVTHYSIENETGLLKELGINESTIYTLQGLNAEQFKELETNKGGKEINVN